ncbi:MAG: purine-nucleoside phosphorylase [Verrucomicrobia bacterium]|nr:purine-nucleoside phosphorylase [Verrucomicrobiota bacterium]
MNPTTTARLIRRRSLLRPKLAMILGSGFQSILPRLDVDREFAFAGLPGFASVAVKGHVGKLILGHLDGTQVAVLSGRAHFYEGHDMARVTFPIRTLAALGVENLLLTNAAGGINPRFKPGDFMLLTDHINLMGVNPLRGAGADGGERFVSLTRAYSPALGGLLAKAAKAAGISLRRGVYLAVSGPSYETPAEIRAFARLGADAVGMSTVPEAIVARQCGLNVAALSCITNHAAGLGSNGELSHGEVLDRSRREATRTVNLLTAFARLYALDRD